MEKAKSRVVWLVIILVLIALYNVIVFLTVKDTTPVFWICYAFTMAALLAQPVIIGGIAAREKTARGMFNAMPVTVISSIYLIAQVISGGLLMLMRAQVSQNFALIAQLIPFAVFLILVCALLLGKRSIQETDSEQRAKVSYIQTLVSELQRLENKPASAAVAKKLRQLTDAAKYSDPMSPYTLIPLENKIMEKVSALEDTLSGGQEDKALSALGEIEALLADRNRECMLLK